MTFLYYDRVSLTPWVITRGSIKLSYFIANRISAEEDFIHLEVQQYVHINKKLSERFNF
jgi:hypothetical protein